MFSTSIAISSSLLASSASAILFNARWRSAGVVSRHSTNALLAALNALSTSAAPETGAVAYAVPVAGLIISLVAPDFAGRDFPSIKLFSFFMPQRLSRTRPIDHMPHQFLGLWCRER